MGDANGMRIIISTRCLINRPAGIGHYTAEMARALARRSDVSLLTYPSPQLLAISGYREKHLGWWKERLQSPRRWHLVDRVSHSLISRAERWYIRNHHFQMETWFNSPTSNVYIEPNHEWIDTHLPTVVVIHDLSVLKHPEWHPESRIREHQEFFGIALQKAAGFVTVSEAIRQELMACFSIPAHRIGITPNSPRSGMTPGQPKITARALSRLGLKPGYFLHVGTLEPRKNLATLVRAWGRLDASSRKKHPLVLAGGTGWGMDDLEQEISRAPAGLVRLGYVAENDIPTLYRGAHALTMPTWYEGFGLPVIEMRACGGAVITSLDPAVREVAGDDTPGIAANDVAGWTEALRRAAEDPSWLEPQRLHGPARAAQFTWDKAADGMIRTCQMAMGAPLERTAAA
jgi:glycosyltransferase involved in cell wall biosynthesis